MASGWVVIRFIAIYPPCMRAHSLTHTHTHQLQPFRYDEWLSFWMFYEITELIRRCWLIMIGCQVNVEKKKREQETLIRLQCEYDSVYNWINPTRLVSMPLFVFCNITAMGNIFVWMFISTPFLSSIYDVFLSQSLNHGAFVSFDEFSFSSIIFVSFAVTFFSICKEFFFDNEHLWNVLGFPWWNDQNSNKMRQLDVI